MPAPAVGEAAFELKGRMTTLSVLQLKSQDARHILAQLDDRLGEQSGLFTGMPLVIAMAEGLEPSEELLREVVSGLRERGVCPVALADMTPTLANPLGLGVMRNPSAPRPPRDAVAAPSTGNGSPTPGGPAKLVSQPIRSGQQIYARGGDLVVVAPVSAGAELMADGHIHVYSSLRGRALAGVQGDRNARIFCGELQAELIAIAGNYLLSEHMSTDLYGGPVTAWLEGETLQLAAI